MLAIKSAIQIERIILKHVNTTYTIFHDCNLPFPEQLKKIDFNLIILGPTFLWLRNDRKKYAKVLQDYDFIRSNPALKVALPQDDYDCPYFLDKWLTDWNINIIFTVLYEHKNLFYKNFINSKKGKIYDSVTSYIDDDLLNSFKGQKPRDHKKIDISYRTHDKGKFLCSIRYQKYNLANIIRHPLMASVKLNIDISNDYTQMIKGKSWYEFLENSKFCLASPSGSSSIDLTGHNRYLINEACKNNPCINFNEIKSTYLLNNDHYNFTALSPRNIESVLSNSCQIAINGNYSEILKPDAHYIPLNNDFSNLEEVMDKINNKELADKITINAKECLLYNKKLRSTYLTNRLDSIIEKYISTNNIKLKHISGKEADLFFTYNSKINSFSKSFWSCNRNTKSIIFL